MKLDGRFTADKLTCDLGITPGPAKQSFSWTENELSDGESDPVFNWLADNGMVISAPNAAGWAEVVCPWAEEHSNDGGTGYHPGNPGGFHCFHSHGPDKTTAELCKWIKKEDPDAVLDSLKLAIQRLAAHRSKINTSSAGSSAGAEASQILIGQISTIDTPDTAKSNRPVVMILAGELPRVVDEAEEALIASEPGLYRYGSQIVRPVWDEVAAAGNSSTRALRLSSIRCTHLREKFECAANFLKLNSSGKFVRASCPRDIPEAYLQRDGEWRLQSLFAVVTAPTLRPDGTIITNEGYDLSTRILFDSLGIEFPSIPEKPTKEDAIAALNMLKDLSSTFPFEKAEDRSVAISAIMTAVTRRAMPVAPIHCFSAPVAGSGKSIWVDTVSVIATGWRAAVTSSGNDKFNNAELEKRLTASMLAGDAIVTLDNLEQPLGGELLCQLMTQHTVKLRPLGHSVNVTVPNTTAFFATGNNLTIIGDMTRRSLVANIDPRTDRPELREFDCDPIAMAIKDRGLYVAAVLTIVRAFVAAGSPRQMPPLGSYGEWSRLVRDPLIWLGMVDPCAVMEKVRGADPQLASLTAVMAQWLINIGAGLPVPVRTVISKAKTSNFGGGQPSLVPFKIFAKHYAG